MYQPADWQHVDVVLDYIRGFSKKILRAKCGQINNNNKQIEQTNDNGDDVMAQFTNIGASLNHTIFCCLPAIYMYSIAIVVMLVVPTNEFIWL